MFRASQKSQQVAVFEDTALPRGRRNEDEDRQADTESHAQKEGCDEGTDPSPHKQEDAAT